MTRPGKCEGMGRARRTPVPQAPGDRPSAPGRQASSTGERVERRNPGRKKARIPSHPARAQSPPSRERCWPDGWSAVLQFWQARRWLAAKANHVGGLRSFEQRPKHVSCFDFVSPHQTFSAPLALATLPRGADPKPGQASRQRARRLVVPNRILSSLAHRPRHVPSSARRA